MNTCATPHASVLSALLRLARRQAPATLEALEVRVDLSRDALALALLELQAKGFCWLERGGIARLTMLGFAAAAQRTRAESPRARTQPRGAGRRVVRVIRAA